MFKSCCARPSKKVSKSKSAPDKMNLNCETSEEKEISDGASNVNKSPNITADVANNEVTDGVEENPRQNVSRDDTPEEETATDTELPTRKSSVTFSSPRPDTRKRYSVDYRRSRIDFKRYSVDLRHEPAALAELSRLEQELARTDVAVRRKYSGILKSTTSSLDERHALPEHRQSDDDDEVFETQSAGDAAGGAGDEVPPEPPATPVGRDELAMRRHRFFSELVSAARAAVEHRVRFDPLGPVVADAGSEHEPPATPAQLEALLERLERVTSRLERLPLLAAPSPAPAPAAPATPAAPAAQDETLIDSMSVNGYQDLVQGPLQVYLNLSKQIGGDVAAHAALVNAAFQAQLQYVNSAAARGRPAADEERRLLAPTSDQIAAIQQYRERNRTSGFFNHLSAISESIPALGWVAVAPTPAPYVKEMNDAGQFYTNRVLKEWKEKDKRHAEWCRAWVQLLAELQAYVKQHHTTGLVWSGKGGAPPPPPPGGMPPPPPALPDVDFSNLSVDDRSALFAEINQGENITSSLRKVTSDMQTHKNPGLRQGPAPFKPARAAPAAPAKSLPAPGAGAADKPPVFMRDGKKWLIEYQRGNSNLVVENADMNNVVYMFRCRDSALTVRGKVNGVVLDSCSKCAVVFDNLVAGVEFVNCQSVQMQVLGKVPIITVDKTDGCQVYLSPESLDVEIVSSKSSEMNVMLPKPNGDYTELPVPEQFKTVLTKSGGLQTTPVENKG